MITKLLLNEALFESDVATLDKDAIFYDKETNTSYLIKDNQFIPVEEGGDSGPEEPPKESTPPAEPPTKPEGKGKKKMPIDFPVFDKPEDIEEPEDIDDPESPEDLPEETEKEKEEDPLKRPGVIVHNNRDGRDYIWDASKNKYVRWR